ncbi:MAG: YicC family protein [Salinarimonadaceae bacterium]|nr:MAG: YicC family protein [Salinarimonadaceae bacterium]
MTIASMTGFARRAGASGPYAWAWEAKSVNGRGLDIRLRTPPGYDALAEEARKRLSAALTRGQCQVFLSLNRAASAPRVRVNHEILAALVEAVAAAPRREGVGPATLDGLLAVRGVVEIEETDDEESLAALRQDLTDALDGLAADLSAARRAEGEALARVIEGQLSAMEALAEAAASDPSRSVEAIRARIGAQIEAIMGVRDGFDRDRLHQEAALIATRADIQEEIDRLRAHVASARALLAEGGAVGRKLDFLAQEFGREANTLCSKANDVSLSRIGLDLKAVVDQFREQVQNVE